jgi:hypothetical protein
MTNESKNPYPRTYRVVPAIAGAVLVAGTFVADLVVGGRGPTAPVQTVLICAGCAIAVIGLASRKPSFGAALTRLSLLLLAVVLVLSLVEVSFRVAGYDFARYGRAARAVPIYYRRPTLHAGEGFYRRPGPDSWHGKPLSAYASLHGLPGAPYSGEADVLIEYDALGFRNPPELTDWDVVVAGDSFVELGFLPYDQLFTTRIGSRLGVRVKNLGVSYTGPLSQEFFLRSYGKAPSAREAVLCFFEGNDLHDLDRETRHAELFRSTGRVAFRPTEKQTSFLRAAHELIPRASRRVGAGDGTENRYGQNAWFLAGERELPMTAGVSPPAWDELRDEQRTMLIAALDQWGRTARSLGMRPWVVYIPDGHRVYHGHVRYMDPDSDLARWTPRDFAGGLGTVCRDLGIQLIDPGPALRGEVEAGRSPYNLIADTHVNALGARVLGDVIADAMTAAQRE